MAYSPQATVAVIWVLYSIDTALVLLRLWVRKIHLGERFLISDYLVMAAAVLALAAGSVCTWLMAKKLESKGATTEFGVVLALGFKRAATYLKMSWAASYLYYCAVYTTKAAFLAFYYGLYRRFNSRAMRITLHCVAAFTLLTFLVNILLNTFLCMPLKRNWSLNPLDQCSATITLSGFTTATVTNVVTDLLLMMIPLRLLKGLKLARREVFAFVFVIAVGSVSVVSSLVRFTLLYAISNALNYTDISIDAFVLWTNVDIAAALAAACLPAFRVLLRRKTRSQPPSNSSYFKKKNSQSRSGDHSFGQKSGEYETELQPLREAHVPGGMDSRVRA